MSVADEIFAIYTQRGSCAYLGERVTMTDHGLQAAYFAEQEAATAALVVAALLHDVGHLLEPTPDDIATWTADAQHESSGARWLARRFIPAVSEPVRLHVAAKRYLCATDPGYRARLSDASVVTLRLQGGPMVSAELARFEAEPFSKDAVRLRLWDDQGKVAGLKTAELVDYRRLIEEQALLHVADSSGHRHNPSATGSR